MWTSVAMLVVAGLAGFFPTAAWASRFAAQIELKNEAQLSGQRYRLGDIAEVRSGDAALVRRLHALNLGLSPRVGYTEKAERAELQARVGRLLPALRGKLDWQGSETVILTVDGKILRAAQYEAVAEGFLNDWLAVRYEDYEIELRDRLADLHLPPGDVKLEARLTGGRALASRICVFVDVGVAGERYRSVPVWFAVKAYDNVLMAAHALPSGTVLERSMLTLARQDVAALGDEVLRPGGDFSEQRLRVPVAAGEALRVTALEPLPPVARGRAVAVTSRSGNVAVLVAATALEDGHVGERVRVRRGEKGESFAVRVTGKASATVDGRGYE